MIQAECGRMKGQVLKILEPAALEKGDLELNRAADAHEAVREAAAVAGVAAAGRGGSITTRLEAEEPWIEADRSISGTSSPTSSTTPSSTPGGRPRSS